MKQFENMTIKELRKLTEEHKKLNPNVKTAQEQIAKEMDVSQDTISKTLKSFKDSNKFIKIFKDMDFEPFLYNVWNVGKDDTKSHFGRFPEPFMENLLYYYTEPFDVVYDPFVGGD